MDRRAGISRLRPLSRVMPPVVQSPNPRVVVASAGRRQTGQIVLVATVHLAAFGLLVWSEQDRAAQAAFVLSWTLCNLFFLCLLRRPLVSGLLSLAMFVLLIVVSQFKHGVLM